MTYKITQSKSLFRFALHCGQFFYYEPKLKLLKIIFITLNKKLKYVGVVKWLKQEIKTTANIFFIIFIKLLNLPITKIKMKNENMKAT